MTVANGLVRHRVRITLALGVFLVFLLSATGVLDLRLSVAPQLAVHERLVHQMVVEGDFPAVVRSRDFAVFGACGLLLALLLPCLSPVPACLLTGAVAFVPFWLTWQFPQHPVFIPLEFTLLMVLVVFVVNVLAAWFAESRSRRNIVDVFGQYVPPQVVEALGARPDRFSLEGEARELSVFFSDIKNFSGISEHLEPRELARLLNTYFTRMTDILCRYDATIDKYIGDAIMAFWGAPLPQPDHARRALDAALEMQRALVDLRREFTDRGWPAIHAGIGISTGVMNVGNMGSRFRIAYTVVGDAVNLGARIEQLTRGYDVGIIVSQRTRAAIDDFLFRELDHVRVRGKHEPTRLFEPLCHVAAAGSELRAALAVHEQGLDAYYGRRWPAAREAFERLQGSPLRGRYYQVLLARIERFEREPPGPQWDGVTVFEQLAG